jgi:hypothetical protein
MRLELTKFIPKSLILLGLILKYRSMVPDKRVISSLKDIESEWAILSSKT